MNSKNYTIGVLFITATILLVGLVLVNVAPRTAQASDVGNVAGDYTLSVGKFAKDGAMFYVIHNPTQQLRAYVITGDQVMIADAIDLAGP